MPVSSNSGEVKYIFILDSDTEFLFADFQDSLIVTTESELNAIDFSEYHPTAIIILAELSWLEKYPQYFYGFNIAIELRQKNKLLCPIILISTFPKLWFEQLSEKEIKYNILFGRGTYFLNVNEPDNKLKEILKTATPLTMAVLADLNDMLLSLKGVVIDRLTHDLQPGIEPGRLAQILHEVFKYLNTYQSLTIGWKNFEQELISASGDPAEFSKIKEALLLKCEQELTDGDIRKPEVSPKKHRVIVLEDDLVFGKKITSMLKEYFEELIVTDQVAEVIELLNKDKGNAITGLIADWRLYVNPQKKYWQMQGYEVLDYAAKNHSIALFSLTSLSDRNVHAIRNMLGLDIHIFKKSYFIDSERSVQWEMMIDTIHQKCDEVIDMLSSQPTGVSWERNRREYIALRTSNWKSYEHEISSNATGIFNFYYNAILNDDYRNVYGIGEMGLSIKNNLKNILIIRRVYLGLYFALARGNKYLQDIRPASFLGDGESLDTELKHHSIDSYSLLKKDWWDDVSAGKESIDIQSEWGKFEQRIKNLRNTLCIELTELPARGLLPEEKNWLAQNNIEYNFLFTYWSTD